MNEDQRKALQKILEQLEDYSSQFLNHGKSSHYIRQSNEENEIVIGGNSEGLAWLSQEIVKLALKSARGAHTHLDEIGMLDHCDTPLVLVLEDAPWDTQLDE